MLTLQNIKDMYYWELAHDLTDRMGFEEYVRERFERVYNEQLDFIGWRMK